MEIENDLTELGLNTRERPRMRREVAIRRHSADAGIIEFYSTQDAIEDFREFGNVEPAITIKDGYTLWVDGRFNFQEVLDYISNYG